MEELVRKLAKYNNINDKVAQSIRSNWVQFCWERFCSLRLLCFNRSL